MSGKFSKKLIFPITLILAGCFGVVTHASFNEQINFQGKLTDSNNVAVENGNYNFQFDLYTTDTAGSSLWTELCTTTEQIAVTDGLFSHLLGSVTSLPDDIFNQTLWLEVKVGATSTSPSWETLSPRKKLGAVPAAFEAKRLEGYGTSSFAILSLPATITGLWNFNNIFSVASSSASTTLTVTQNGEGSIVDIKNATGSVFAINNAGAIATGIWQGTAIGAAYGGTGQNFTGTATGSLVYFSATGTMGALSAGTSTWMLSSNGANTLPTYISTTTLGTNLALSVYLTSAVTSLNGNTGAQTLWGTADQITVTASGTAGLIFNTGSVIVTTRVATLSSLTSIGTIATGTWQATPIGSAYGGTATSTASWTGFPYITSGVWGTSTTGILSGGQANYLSKWTSATALSTTTIYDSSGNIGIGTTSPATTLTVYGTTTLLGGNVGIGTSTPAYTLDAYGTFRAVSTSTFSGRVGIATSSPARMLEVLDISNPQMRITQAGSKYAEFQVDASGDLNVTLSASNNNLILSTYNLYLCSGGCPSFTLSNGGNLVVENESYFAGDKIQYPSSLGQPKRSIILTSAGAITPTSLGASQTKIDGTNSTYYVLDYADATTSSAFWEWIMPDSFATATAATSVIDVTIYWTATTTGNVIWGLQTIGVSNNENIDQALSNTATTTGAAQATSTYLASATFTNYVVDWAPQDYISFNVYREGGNGADTLAAAARLVKVKIEYPVKQESD